MSADLVTTLANVTVAAIADKAKELLKSANEVSDNVTTLSLPTTTTTIFITNSTTAGPRYVIFKVNVENWFLLFL